MKYLVTIDSADIGGASPSDGFVDPVSVEDYRHVEFYTGSAAPTVIAGDTFYIRDVIVTSSGTTLSTLIADINAKTKQHFVVAAENSGKLSLSMLPSYSRYIPSITEITEGVLARYGFVSPVVTNDGILPTTATSIIKERGNVRWELVLQSLQLTSNIGYQVIEIVGADTETPPTAIAFYVDVPDTYYSFDFTGDKVYGKIAVQYAVAKALLFSTIKNRQTIEQISLGQIPEIFQYDTVVEELTIGSLTTDSGDAIAAVTVEVA